MITTCIFDLDGTLVDSLEDLAYATNYILKEYGYPTHAVDMYRSFVGDGVDTLLQRALPKENKDDVKEVRAKFDSIYVKNCLRKTKPYEGIIDMVKQLKDRNIRLAVVTNKPEDIAKKIVQELFGNSFTYVYGNSDMYPKKPDPYLVNKVIDLFVVNKEQVLYIGDSDVDMITAKNAGIKVIGVNWGFRGRKELLEAGADKVIDSPLELGGIVDDWSK